ncbi:MAG: protein kinase [Xanthomonadales bacterium]|nr:protein kinase [Xanthomonadales bacterium]
MAATESSPRWSLATQIFLLTALLVVLVVGLAVGVGVMQGQRLAQQSVDESLTRSTITQVDIERLRARQAELVAEIIATDTNITSYIRQAAGDELFGDGAGQDTELDRASIADLMAERQAEYEFDLAVVLGVDGEVLARSDRPVRDDETLSEDPLVAEMVAELIPITDIWRDGQDLYQMAMTPMDENFNLIGFLMIGMRIDASFLDEVKRATGAEQIWTTPDGQSLSTLPAVETEQILADLNSSDTTFQALMAGQSDTYRRVLDFGGSSWKINVEPVALDETQVLAAVMSLVPLEPVLAPHRRQWMILGAVGAAAILLGLALSLMFSRRVTRPLSQLSTAAAAASAGDYKQHFDATGSSEIVSLGEAFESLLSELREKQDMEEYVSDLSRFLPDPGMDSGGSNRTQQAGGKPAREELALLALDYRHLARHDESSNAEDSIRRFQASLSQIAALAEVLDASLESFSGHRAIIGFRGAEAVPHALEFSGHVAEHASDKPSMALVMGVVDRGMVRAGLSTAEVLIGRASHQLDLLLEEADTGMMLLSPGIKSSAETLLERFDVQAGVRKGRLSGRKYYALDFPTLAQMASDASERTIAVDVEQTESVIESVSRTREIVPGDVFADRYEVISILGQGGMGVVYKALDRELEDFVALKTLLPDTASDSQYLEQLKEEIRLARKVTHPNVLRTFDFGSHHGLAYVSMEYVRGMTLRFLMKRARLPFSAGLRISRQVCAGLAAAHGEDVVHRDIKPENVILQANGNAKLMDFGIASPVNAGDEGLGVFAGTPRYASPEQMEGKGLDATADVFACGVMMYELFSGETPFPGTDLMEIYMAKRHGTGTPLGEVWTDAPAGVEAVVMRCLAPDLDQRYANGDELGAALGDLRA